MGKISLDVWIQLLGMIGIIVSLVFVALQMRQSHQFALAAQQTARMEVFCRCGEYDVGNRSQLPRLSN